MGAPREIALGSLLTSPLCATVEMLLAPRGCRRTVWRESRRVHCEKGGREGVMGWAAWLWLASFFVLLVVVISLGWVSPWTDGPQGRGVFAVGVGLGVLAAVFL